jgi:hypothetical protein
MKHAKAEMPLWNASKGNTCSSPRSSGKRISSFPSGPRLRHEQFMSRDLEIEYSLIIRINAKWGVATSERMTPTELLAEFGCDPAQFSLYKHDSSDRIRHLRIASSSTHRPAHKLTP